FIFTTYNCYFEKEENMGLKGKLTVAMEAKCGGHSIHNIIHTNTHHVPTISRVINEFEIHEGETIKIGSVVSWNYNDAGQKKFMKQVVEAIDPHQKLSRWKIIEGDVLDIYSSFTIVTCFEPQWSIWTIEYEKKTEDTPEPLTQLGLLIDMSKDIESHLLKN
ncbi:hypothetical protein AABB24_027586, partial [Solanum stoloniferum]